MTRGALSILLLSMAACGGTTLDLGSTDAGPTGDGAPPPTTWSPVCPASEPTIGGACTTESLTCEYGTFDPNPACVTLLTCQSGAWAAQPSYFGACPTPAPNPSVCAPTFAGVVRGAACAPQGATCTYAQGDCRCETQFFGGPVPYFPDGGGPSPTWDCDDPGTGCPEPRARIGSACSTDGQSCEYRRCELEEECTKGYWQAPPIACAAAGGGGAP